MRKIICLGVLAIAVSASAEVYRWVDSEGKTHYGDRLPQEQRNNATHVDIKVAPAQVDPDAEKARQQLRSIEEGRQREREFNQQKSMQEQKRREDLARRCKALQVQIRQDRDTAVFYRYDEAGNRVLWSNEERVTYRDKLQNLRQTYCPDLSE